MEEKEVRRRGMDFKSSLHTASRILFTGKYVASPDAPRGYRGDNACKTYGFPAGRNAGP